MQAEMLSQTRPDSPLKRPRDDEAAASDLEPLSPRTKKMRLADQDTLDLASSTAISADPPVHAGEILQRLTPEQPSHTGLDSLASPPRSSDKSKGKGKKRKEKRKSDWGDKKGGRGRESAVSATVGQEGSADGDAEGGKSRLPKRKVALLLGFCGTGCSGMQYQREATTIEGILFTALAAAGCVSEDNADDPNKVSLQRAARTDAGVHAAGNVVSLKMITQLPDVEDVIGHVNTFLPPQIRVWGNAQSPAGLMVLLVYSSCDSRVYEYLFPSYLLLPPKPGSKMATQIVSDKPVLQAKPNSAVASDSIAFNPFWQEANGENNWESDLKRKRSWRAPSDIVDRLRSLVKLFEGTHNFHNYTIGRNFKDRSNKRYMISIQVRDPEVYGEMEWISVMFHGQSFMLHQIRKMIAMVILACRANCPSNLIPESYGPSRIRIPKAPALGLLLEAPRFGAYNTKILASNQTLDENRAKGKSVSDADYREPIDFAPYQDAINKFKVEQIYERLRAEEEKTSEFDIWIRTMDSYRDYDLAYLNSRGVIPPEAVASEAKVKAASSAVDATGVEKASERTAFDEDDDIGADAAKLEEMEG